MVVAILLCFETGSTVLSMLALNLKQRSCLSLASCATRSSNGLVVILTSQFFCLSSPLFSCITTEMRQTDGGIRNAGV